MEEKLDAGKKQLAVVLVSIFNSNLILHMRNQLCDNEPLFSFWLDFLFWSLCHDIDY